MPSTPAVKCPRVRSLLKIGLSILNIPGLFAISAHPIHADATKIRQIVESGALAENPNSILLDYLLNEGKDALPPNLHQQAVDQMVEALRTQTLVDPLEGMDQIMTAMSPMKMFGGPKGIMKQMGMGMLRSATGGGGGMSSGMNNQMQQMRNTMDSAMIDPWVRGLGAAATLTQAGYAEDASRFYRGCLTSMGSAMPTGQKNDWLQEQCINGALLMGPRHARDLFGELWDEPYMNIGFDVSAYGGEMPVSPEVRAVAAQGLGKLVGSGQLTSQQRSGAMQALIDQVQVKKADLTSLTGAVQGLSFAEDPQAVQPLHKMWKKGKPQEIRPIALGGLVAAYRRPDAIKAMRKNLKGGEPATRYLAARTLIRAGDDAGYKFAAKFLDKRNVPEGDWDFRPDLIRDLVETGGDRSLSVLDDMVTDGHKNEWLEAMMRTGLFEIGDRDQIPELLALINKRDWNFGRGTVGRWYKRFKPLLWQGAKLAAKTYLGMPPDQQDWQRVRQMVTNLAWGERDRILARKSERDVKTDQFRWQLADSAGEIDDPRCLNILAPLLSDEEPSVRMSAASALLDQSDPRAAELLLVALSTDYGAEQNVSRNPEIHAAIVRRLIRSFPDQSATREALKQAARSESPSVRFLAVADELATASRATV